MKTCVNVNNEINALPPGEHVQNFKAMQLTRKSVSERDIYSSGLARLNYPR